MGGRPTDKMHRMLNFIIYWIDVTGMELPDRSNYVEVYEFIGEHLDEANLNRIMRHSKYGIDSNTIGVV